MGSSGAGKTTLLNIVADQISKNKTSKLSGDVVINDSIKVTQNNFGSYAAYVTQDDYLFESFTCRKCIEFAAKLRLNLPQDQTDERVESIIYNLNLQNCKDTIVGNETIKGLSGGERKRTAIAVELVTNPKILFLDEPTSGLDSFTAHKIVSLLVDFAKKGRTVLATIHQPNSDTFQLFPKLLLLMDGHTIYHGDTMSSVGYFDKLGFKIPQYSNPADFYLKQFYVPFERSQEKEKEIDLVVSSYQNNMLPDIITKMNEIEFDPVTEKEMIKSMVKAKWCKEFWILL